MTPREIIYDVRHILNRLGNESSLPDLWILEKINKYREIQLMNYKFANNYYPEQSYQYFPAVLGNLVSFNNYEALDPRQSHENALMKYWIPDFIDISGVWTESGLGRLNKTCRDLIMLRIQLDTDYSVNDYFYWIEDNFLMLYNKFGNYRETINIRLIAGNPLQVDVVRNWRVKSGQLKSGDQLSIFGNNYPNKVEYDGVQVNEQDGITVPASYNGINNIRKAGQQNYVSIAGSYLTYDDIHVQRGLDDHYPETRSIIQSAIIEFITRDMNIEYKMIEEAVVNGRDDLKVLNTNQ